MNVTFPLGMTTDLRCDPTECNAAQFLFHVRLGLFKFALVWLLPTRETVIHVGPSFCIMFIQFGQHATIWVRVTVDSFTECFDNLHGWFHFTRNCNGEFVPCAHRVVFDVQFVYGQLNMLPGRCLHRRTNWIKAWDQFLTARKNANIGQQPKCMGCIIIRLAGPH